MPCSFVIFEEDERIKQYPVSPAGYRTSVQVASESPKTTHVLLSCDKGTFVILECGHGSCKPRAVKTDYQDDVAIAGKKRKKRRR